MNDPVTKPEFKLLGHQAPSFPGEATPEILETFENRTPHRDYLIRFDCSDFTSLCPVTGQPDFAELSIEYVPSQKCLETKSLKFYLASFRNTRAFNEEIVNRLLDDLVTACGPKRMAVTGRFASRGGIALTASAIHPPARPEDLL